MFSPLCLAEASYGSDAPFFCWLEVGQINGISVR